ncbi:MAG: CocE/NonD family hydrolase [Pirellulales bacterium]
MRHLLCWLFAALSWAAFPEVARAEITVETVLTPMRDGIRLATDVYRDANRKSGPVLLMRTPYNKDRAKGAAQYFANAGYIAVVQDCRGKFASEGTFVPYNQEGQDGYDAVEWIGKQPWCNGRIGMWGSSYVGATQWQAAVERPPGLVAIAPTATWTSFYRNLYLGGAVRLSLITRWAAGNSPIPPGATATNDWDQTLHHLPLDDFDLAIGWPIPWLRGMLTHPEPNGYWTRLDLTQQVEQLDLPVQHVVGYYDFFSRESVESFVRMQQRAKLESTRRRQQLILGPWDHGTIGQTKVGDVDFGPQAAWDLQAANLEWFDRHVKQAPELETRPFAPVRYFSMGDNRWFNAETWPPADAQLTPFYLHSQGGANTRAGDGRLTRTAPTSDEPHDEFRADPAAPVPACPVTPQRPLNAATWAPVDQRPLEDRPDVLVYSSEKLAEPLTIAGDVKAELYVSADTPDADWVVKLIDVHPDGFAQNLNVGILRARYRKSERKPELLTPGETTKIVVDLGPVAVQLGVGHTLRVDVCGAYFPLFDRNPNTAAGPFGKETAVATERVHHSPQSPSRLWLPLR